jgi:predicted RNase H-like HicB family nuclease
MDYRLGVEDIEPYHWLAWVLDLPGCFAAADSEAAAVAAAPAAIRAYLAWHAGHGAVPGAPPAPARIQVAEVFHGYIGQGDYWVNALFADDRRPLTPADVDTGLRLLSYTRQDLAGLVTGLAPAALAAPHPAAQNASINSLLQHLATAECWYFANLGLEQPDLPADPLIALDQVRAQTRAWLPTLIGDGRIWEQSGEAWSARKVLRRTLWHERTHTAQITGLLS